ncbi:hypothetical protein QLH32_17665 [Acinetobacter corruptisaponis]|uniref:Uncharacterized protein n=1 Tax=Acinetobacter corruptisaponis TaxID=3045147 RepID=A0ABY8S351_9GAMM|nr:hypothetical protein [Acinetobacter sp. KCTC 92772]WHP05806.1 hypothetical protein QLH32_17665 [Acinetobacter sp. KCTC 92772]
MDKLIISETPIHIAKETIVHEIAWGGVTGNIVDQDDLNTVLDSFVDDLNNLTEEVETKASAAAVVQALTTKADLIDGVIPASQLPSYVDDVLVYPTWADFPVVGEAGKIYVTEDTNKTYRWSGSGYVVIADGVALGETATTAYRGDRGKAAYDHSLSQGNPHNATTSDIPEGNKLYFTENRVRQSTLTGLPSVVASPIVETDIFLNGFAKLQAQIDKLSVKWVSIEAISEWVNPNLSIASTDHGLRFAVIGGVLFVAGLFYLGGSDYNLCRLKPEYKMYNAAGVNGQNAVESVKCVTNTGLAANSFFTQCPSGNSITTIASTYTNIQYLRTSRLSDTMLVNGFLGKLIHYN